MIRRAEYSDKAAVVELLRESHAEAGFPFEFCEESASYLFESHVKIKSHAIFVLTARGSVSGLLMVGTYPHPFGAGLWARETVWYVSKEARGLGAVKMLHVYEQWARELGCAAVSMATLATNDVSPIYERIGYSKAETHFVKYLK